MKELKRVFASLNEFRNEDPKGFYGSIIFVIFVFIFIYLMLWLGAIVDGRI